MQLDLYRDGKVSYQAALVFSHVKECASPESILSLSEAGYYTQLKSEKRKRDYLLGRWTAKKALIEFSKKTLVMSDISIDHGVMLQPVVVSNFLFNTQVSIAHSKTSAIAVTFPEQHPMAVDLQYVDVERQKALLSCQTTIDQQALREVRKSEIVKATLLWTLKESLSKVIKTGLTLPFSEIQIKEIQDQKTHYCSFFKNWTQYKALSWIVNDYCFSLVLPRDTRIKAPFYNVGN